LKRRRIERKKNEEVDIELKRNMSRTILIIRRRRKNKKGLKQEDKKHKI
jgi:hypothetical protein